MSRLAIFGTAFYKRGLTFGMRQRPPHTQDPSFVSGDDAPSRSGRGGGARSSSSSGGGGLLPWVLLFLLLVAVGAGFTFVFLPLRQEAETSRRLLLELNDTVTKLHQQVASLETSRASLAQARDNLAAEVDAKEQDLQQLQQTEEELAQKLASEVQAGDVAIRREKGELVVDLVDQILFDSGAATLHARGRAVLKQVADSLRKVHETIEVRGHTDAQPIAKQLVRHFASNWELSTERATHVVRFLQDDCALSGSRLIAAGFAQYRPVADNKSERGRRLNRRIELVLLRGSVAVAAPEH